jgi:hypothetical protein
MNLTIEKRNVIIISDSGAELSITSENLFNKLEDIGLQTLTIPISNSMFVSAFGSSMRHIKKQALI